MKNRIECWRCGTALKPDQLPINRLEQCHRCHADLYVCRMCRSWNPRYTSKCSHDHAEPPLDRERANFCQYFKPAAGVFRNAGAPAGETARTDLEALFGAGPAPDSAASSADSITETERARRALEDLFGGNKENDSPGSS